MELLLAWSNAMSNLVKSARLLSRVTNRVSQTEFNQLSSEWEDVRFVAEEARTAYNHHRFQHGC
jgi:hypothetical protein